MDYRYILWDWNGTLLDDVSASLASVNDMLASRQMPPLDLTRYRDCIGVPIVKFYERVFDLENEDYAEILRQYNEGYLYHLKDCSLAQGSLSLLQRFRQAGCGQVIVSSSQCDQLCENVEKYGVGGYFDAVLGAGDYFATSKIDRARAYLDSHESGKALVIGDLEHDAAMADELGADCILITYGHEKYSRLAATGATLCGSMGEIEKLLFES
ncbi:MAG: HAD family hydrolase [Clostridia bacterium]|nr:HAD family hydrolase [Clostridia bacterium]